jgi:hypothetical protein
MRGSVLLAGSDKLISWRYKPRGIQPKRVTHDNLSSGKRKIDLKVRLNTVPLTGPRFWCNGLFFLLWFPFITDLPRTRNITENDNKDSYLLLSGDL